MVATRAMTPMIVGMMNSALPMKVGAPKNMVMNAAVHTMETSRVRRTRAGAGERSGRGPRTRLF